VLIALLVALSSIGGAAVFLSSTSRLPFVAGIDSYLPKAFGSVHAQWGTPWIAIIVYGIAGMLCALLSQAGSSVEGAYDLLVSMSVITYFIPFCFLFLAMIRLQREPAPPDVVRLPGGKPIAILLASVGLVTTLFAIVLSVIPAENEPHKTLAVAKILGSTSLMVGAGVIVFWSGARRQRASVRM
jgi:amino acid transporter